MHACVSLMHASLSLDRSRPRVPTLYRSFFLTLSILCVCIAGRYAIHWHMVGNLRESYQRNVSVHHSWNRGVAIHGINYLRLHSNFAYQVMGHTFFIEDGPEEFNHLENNLAIKTIPSMNLLNTDQTPAGFWIVSGANFILGNHAVASRRYGMWFRPEMAATGTSFNTPDVHPINIPVLEFRGNQAHSNGKYGLRVFDLYKPNAPSVIRDLFVWRNGKVGWTATGTIFAAFTTPTLSCLQHLYLVSTKIPVSVYMY